MYSGMIVARNLESLDKPLSALLADKNYPVLVLKHVLIKKKNSRTKSINRVIYSKQVGILAWS